jgi:bifunctional non-homologous end joining protein LigD
MLRSARSSTARPRWRGYCTTEAGIRFNEHIAEDGPIVFAHACRLGAEGIVSKKVDSVYRSGPCRVWIKVRNPASIAVQRERSEMWNR